MKITKKAIQALATQSVKDQYALEVDKVIYLENVIDAGGFEISLTDNRSNGIAASNGLRR